MPIHERGAERRIRPRQHEARGEEARPSYVESRTSRVALEARAEEQQETEQKTGEIREALKELERAERKEVTQRKVARARLHQELEAEEAAREYRLAKDLPGPDAINAIADEEERMHAYEKSFGLVEAHFQQKVEEAKNILGQEKAAAIWDEILPLLGRDNDEATRYVFQFAAIAKDAAKKDADELKGDIEALNEKYDLPSTYNPMRAEMQKWKKPPMPSEPRQPPRAGPEVVTAQNVERWREQLVALNEDLHTQIADLSAKRVPRERIEAVSERIKATEAELAKINEYKDIGADLAGEALSYELRLKEMAKRMNTLSEQIKRVYGKTPEELRSLGGAGIIVARVKNWLSKISGKPALLGEWEEMNEEHEHLAELLEDYRGTYRASAGEKKAVRLPSRKEREQEERLREIAPLSPDVAGMSEAEYEKQFLDEESETEAAAAVPQEEPAREARVVIDGVPLEAGPDERHAARESKIEIQPPVEPPPSIDATQLEQTPVKPRLRPRVLEVKSLQKKQAPEAEYPAKKEMPRPERAEIEALAQTLSELKKQTDKVDQAFYREMLKNIRNASDPKTWNAARAFVEKRGYRGWKPWQFKEALALHEVTDKIDTALRPWTGELRDHVEAELQEQIRTLRKIQKEDPEDFNEYVQELADFIAVFRKGGDVTKTAFGKTHVTGKAFQGWKVEDFERLRDAFASAQPRAERKRATSAPRSRASSPR